MICIFAITLRQALAEFFNRLLVGHFSPDLTPSHLTHRACRHCPMRGPDRGVLLSVKLSLSEKLCIYLTAENP